MVVVGIDAKVHNLVRLRPGSEHPGSFLLFFLTLSKSTYLHDTVNTCYAVVLINRWRYRKRVQDRL